MIQVMSAGSGVTHSEYNASPDEAAAFLQIWIQPHTRNLSPRHEEKTMDYMLNTLTLLVSPDARDGSISIYQDVLLYR
jgi:quercetin 2,3-dioxygenase